MKTAKLAVILRDIAYKTTGISPDTRNERALHVERFAQHLLSNNIQVRTPFQLRIRHIETYIRAKLASGKSKRTLQNEMASLRAVLREAGHASLVGNPRLTNKALGLSGASRAGTNRAMTRDEYQRARAALTAKGAFGEALALDLMLTLGLREKEAVMSPKSLTDWQRQLIRGERIRVTHGTKGGRPRDVLPSDPEEALRVVNSAKTHVEDHGGVLIRGKGLTLDSARNRLDNQMRAVLAPMGISAHSARYAFAQNQVDFYLSQGYERREALAQASCDLGHGSSRYRYIGQVYDQRR